MYLHELLKTYYEGTREYEEWKKAFPQMHNYALRVEVIPWSKEFERFDTNPEIIDEFEFYKDLLKNGLISEKEFESYTSKLTSYARKTLGISFPYEEQVSFREKVPSLKVIIHELGHIYFKKPDSVWSEAYMGGETLMWAIAFKRIPGEEGRNEEFVKNYMEAYELALKKPEEAKILFEAIAREAMKEIKGIENNPETFLKKAGFPDLEPTWLNALMVFNGTLPSKDYTPAHYLQNLMIGALYSQSLPKLFISNLIKENPHLKLLQLHKAPSQFQSFRRKPRMGF